MFELIAVTSRHLCKTDFLGQIGAIARAGVSALILREKDIPEREYEALAKEALAICAKAHTPLILHRFVDAARRLGADKIHLSLNDFVARPDARELFEVVGVSVHSSEQAREAAGLGADYLVAGHVFETDCKKGMEPRGLSFLKEVCGGVAVPVFAIGGINRGNIVRLPAAGARGACIMSGFMESADPARDVEEMRRELGKSSAAPSL